MAMKTADKVKNIPRLEAAIGSRAAIAKIFDAAALVHDEKKLVEILREWRNQNNISIKGFLSELKCKTGSKKVVYLRRRLAERLKKEMEFLRELGRESIPIFLFGKRNLALRETYSYFLGLIGEEEANSLVDEYLKQTKTSPIE